MYIPMPLLQNGMGITMLAPEKGAVWSINHKEEQRRYQRNKIRIAWGMTAPLREKGISDMIGSR